jgi:hypothetical protein
VKLQRDISRSYASGLGLRFRTRCGLNTLICLNACYQVFALDKVVDVNPYRAEEEQIGKHIEFHEKLLM